jgi:hypothetical protein
MRAETGEMTDIDSHPGKRTKNIKHIPAVHFGGIVVGESIADDHVVIK